MEYRGDYFLFLDGTVHPDTKKIFRLAHKRDPTEWEREQVRERIKDKLAWLTREETTATAENLKRIDAELKAITEEMKDE